MSTTSSARASDRSARHLLWYSDTVWCRRFCRSSSRSRCISGNRTIRSATIIGAVGAGGIGLKLLEAMGTNADWDKVAYMVLLILIVVFVFDNISGMLRQRLIDPKGNG